MARYLVSGGGDKQLRQSLEKMGTPQDQIDKVAPEHVLEVWPQNAETVHVFVRCRTQWMLAPMSGQPIGLMHPSVESAIRMLGYWDKAADIYDGIGVMEDATLKIAYNKR